MDLITFQCNPEGTAPLRRFALGDVVNCQTVTQLPKRGSEGKDGGLRKNLWSEFNH